MDRTSATPESRRAQRWLYVLIVPTFLSIFAVSWAFENRDLEPTTRLLLSVIPVGLWGTMIVMVIAGVRRLDELQQRIQLEALAFAFPTSMMLGMLVEYLQKAGFATGVSVGDVWPWMILLYAPAYFVARWRYR